MLPVKGEMVGTAVRWQQGSAVTSQGCREPGRVWGRMLEGRWGRTTPGPVKILVFFLRTVGCH